MGVVGPAIAAVVDGGAVVGVIDVVAVVAVVVAVGFAGWHCGAGAAEGAVFALVDVDVAAVGAPGWCNRQLTLSSGVFVIVRGGWALPL